MESKNARGSSSHNPKIQKSANSHQITAFFKKAPSGQEAEQRPSSNKPLTEEQVKDIPKINQEQPREQLSSSPKKANLTTAKRKQSGKSIDPPQDEPEDHIEEQLSHAESKPDIVDDKMKELDKEIEENQDQDEAQGNTQGDQSKKSLRPRKVQNYKKLLEGDEVTIKTIEDEQKEIRKRLAEDGDYVEDQDMLEQEIERASDDDDEDYAKRKVGSKVKRRAKVVDEDNEEENLSSSSSDDALMDDLEHEEISVDAGSKRKQKEEYKKKQKKGRNKADDADLGEDEEDTVFIDNLPQDEQQIRKMLRDVKKHIKDLEKQFFEEEDSEQEEELKKINVSAEQHDEMLLALQEHSYIKSFWCIPLSIDVRNDKQMNKLVETQKSLGGRLFDVITIDPPWQLSSANPTRGVAIAYDTLNDKEILALPFNKLQTDGFIFIWVINAKYRFALQMMEEFGYKLVDEIAWVKQTVNGKIAKGHGYYLQHAKETCLVGVKGNVKGKARFNIESDVIFSQRRGQSQKPEEIYEIVEALVPNGYYLEIFGRRNNLHNGWVTVGNEI